MHFDEREHPLGERPSREGLSDFLCDRFAFVFSARVLRPELDAVALEARDDVDMDMVDALPRMLAVVVIDVYAVGIHALFDGNGHFAHRFLYRRPDFGCRLEHVRDVLLGHDERMTGGHRFDGKERDGIGVFKDADRREFTADDLAEDAVGHRESIAKENGGHVVPAAGLRL